MRDGSREHVELDNDDLNFPARADEKRLHVAGKWSTRMNYPRTRQAATAAGDVEQPAGTDISP